MTNLEYMRTLNAEELAECLYGDRCKRCAYEYREHECNTKPCKEGTVEWLNQEHKTALKPCPFCVGNARMIGATGQTCCVVYCSECMATQRGDTEAAAIEAWNRWWDKTPDNLMQEGRKNVIY